MLTTQQSADRWGVKQHTVVIWILRGKIKAEKFGRDWMISEGTEKPTDKRKGPK